MSQYETRLNKMLEEKPKCLNREIEDFKLFGEHDYRMNTVHLMETQGADLVSALSVVDVLVKKIKIILKETKV